MILERVLRGRRTLCLWWTGSEGEASVREKLKRGKEDTAVIRRRRSILKCEMRRDPKNDEIHTDLTHIHLSFRFSALQRAPLFPFIARPRNTFPPKVKARTIAFFNHGGMRTERDFLPRHTFTPNSPENSHREEGGGRRLLSKVARLVWGKSANFLIFWRRENESRKKRSRVTNQRI